MKKILIILNSTIFMVLFCFSDIFSLPLTKSCYTTTEENIDLSLNEQFIYIDEINRKDIFTFNIGVGSYTSLGSEFSLIHHDSIVTGESVPGDILFSLWHFIGEYCDGAFTSGINFVMRVPTGPDVYTDEKYKNLSFGNNELKITPVLSFKPSEKETLILNLSYTFREGKGDYLYSEIKDNLFSGEIASLENDYASASAGVVTSRLFPWIFLSEIYFSSGFDDGDKEDINIEGDGITPLLFSFGVKYFFSDSLFVQFSNLTDLLQNKGYIKNTVEISLNIFF